MSRRARVMLVAAVALYWAAATGLTAWRYSPIPFLSTAGAVTSAIIDTTSLLLVWLVAAAVALHFPLDGRHAWRNLVITAAIAVVVLVLRIAALRHLMMPLGWFAEAPLRASILNMLPPNLLTFTVLWFGGWSVAQYSRNARLALAAASLRLNVLQARYAALSSPLQPHFIGNALNALSWMIYEAPAAARDMIAQLRDLIVRAEQHTEAPEVRLEEEMALVHRWLDVQRTRFGDRLQVAISTEVAARDAWIPSLSVQPLVENVLKHAVARVPGTVHVWIRAVVRGGRLRVMVEDDGPGPGRLPVVPGVGTGSIRRRIELLYGGNAELVILPRPGGGTVAWLEVPLRHEPGLASQAAGQQAAAPTGGRGPVLAGRSIALAAWAGLVAVSAAVAMMRSPPASAAHAAALLLVSLATVTGVLLLCLVAFRLANRAGDRRRIAWGRVAALVLLLAALSIGVDVLLDHVVAVLLVTPPQPAAALTRGLTLWLIVLHAMMAGLACRFLAVRYAELRELEEEQAALVAARHERLSSELRLDRINRSFDRISAGLDGDPDAANHELALLAEHIAASLAASANPSA